MQDEGFCSHGSAQAILSGPGTTGCVIAMTIRPSLSPLPPAVWNTQMGLITSKSLGPSNLNPPAFLTPGPQAPAGPLLGLCAHMSTRFEKLQHVRGTGARGQK